MALEYELKYCDVDLGEVRVRLGRAGAEHLRGPYLESNIVFDDQERSLMGAQILLRLRRRGDAREGVLTLKRPAPPEMNAAGVKAREEIQTSVADFEVMRAIVPALGLSESLAYEKVRETWQLGSLVVCLDRLPFGDFVELEGTPEDISNAAQVLGLDPDRSTNDTYHDLNRAWREREGLSPGADFVFDEACRKRLMKEL